LKKDPDCVGFCGPVLLVETGGKRYLATRARRNPARWQYHISQMFRQILNTIVLEYSRWFRYKASTDRNYIQNHQP